MNYENAVIIKKHKAKDYDIDISTLPSEIVSIAENVDRQTAGAITKSDPSQVAYETVLDYYAIYYVLRFERHYDNHKISVMLEIDEANIIEIYQRLGWNYDDYSFEKNEMLRKEDNVEFTRIYQEGLKNIRDLNIADYPQLLEMLENNDIIDFVNKKIIGKKYGDKFLDHRDFIIKLYYFYYIDPQPMKVLVKLLGLNRNTANGWLAKFGIRRNPEEGMRIKKLKKAQDYGNSMRKGRATTRDSQIENGNTASAAENELRGYIMDAINNIFPSNTFDVIVGVNSRSNLSDKEIDIPIWIHILKTPQIYKFVFEYNGRHDDDLEKIKMSKDRGWIYMSLQGKTSDSTNPKGFRKRAYQVCLDMEKHINATEQHAL